MKKISIPLIIFISLTTFFAPLNVILDQKNDINFEKKEVSADGCTIKSAIFSPSGENKNWYKESNGQPPLKIIVKTKDCLYQVLNLTVYEADTCGLNCDDALSDSDLLRHPFSVPSDNFTINLIAGEEECESPKSSVGIGIITTLVGDHCDLFFRIRQGDDVLYYSWNNSEGRLQYDCDISGITGSCSANAKWIGVTPNGTDDAPTNIGLGSQTASGKTEQVYTLLAPIPGLDCVSSTGADKTGAANKCAKGGIGDYLNILFRIGIGICGVLAVIMLVINGIKYMTTESFTEKAHLKHDIWGPIGGLLLALGAYAILNTIDPALTGKDGASVDQVSIELKAIENIDPGSFTQITGKKFLTPSEYDTIGKKVAKDVGIPFCALRVILERESKGNPGAVGFDENVRNSAIPSRIAFVNSGKKYNGEVFSSSTDLITKQGFVNQGKKDIKNTPGLGLDWRFSKGLGLTQITLFPPGYFTSGYKNNPPGLDKKDSYPTLNGFTPKDLLDPEKNLTAGATIWKSFWIKCNKNIYNTWSGYGSGSCTANSDFIKKEAEARTQYYNGCSELDKTVQ